MILRSLIEMLPDNGRIIKAPYRKLNNTLRDFIVKTIFNSFSSPSKKADGFLGRLFKKNMKRMVFGLGTGRCGTVTLADLLNSQVCITAHHEIHKSPWVFDMTHLKHTIVKVQSCHDNVVGDVSSWHLPYVKKILKIDPRTKFVCLKRNKEEIIESFLRKTSGRNHWTSRTSNFWNSQKWKDDERLDFCFPKYDLDIREAIARYWDEYYALAEQYAVEYPDNFRIFDMNDSLNTESGQREMLQFVGVDPENMIILTHKKLNKSNGV